MSMVCPIKECKAQQGMCIHDKILLAIVVVAVVLGGYYYYAQ